MGLLHVDGGTNYGLSIVLISRLFALPTRLIASETYNNADEETLVLIQQAKSVDDKGRKARKKLYEPKILQDAPLSALMAITSDDGGNFHCASSVPAGGIISCFSKSLLKRSSSITL